MVQSFGWPSAVIAAGVVLLGVSAGEVSAAGLPTFTSAVPLQRPAGASVSVDTYDPVSASYGAAGQATFGWISQALWWSSDGSPTLLGGIPGWTIENSIARGINASGQVAGDAKLTGFDTVRAVRWSADGSGSLLSGVPGRVTGISQAFGINNAGQVAGHIGYSGSVNRGVRWEANGSAMVLGDVPGRSTYSSVGYDINDAGQVIGSASLSGFDGSRAVRWETDGTAALLGNVPEATTNASIAYGINSAGQAAGLANLSIGLRAVRWEEDGSATLLGDIPGRTTSESRAYGISDGGLVAGIVTLDGVGARAAIWDAGGNAALLQDLMFDDGNTWTFLTARGIDADATTLRVLALGIKDGDASYNWYFVSATIPEPRAAGLASVAVVGVVVRRRWRARGGWKWGGN